MFKLFNNLFTGFFILVYLIVIILFGLGVVVLLGGLAFTFYETFITALCLSIGSLGIGIASHYYKKLNKEHASKKRKERTKEIIAQWEKSK